MNEYETVIMPELILAGIECVTSNDPSQGPVDIPKLWERFFQEGIAEILEKNPHRASEEIMGLYYDYESDHNGSYTLLIGGPVVKTDDLPPMLRYKKIPRAQYAKFTAKGPHPQALIETWQSIWGSGMKRSYAGDLEVYGKGFQKTPQEVEILIAL